MKVGPRFMMLASPAPMQLSKTEDLSSPKDVIAIDCLRWKTQNRFKSKDGVGSVFPIRSLSFYGYLMDQAAAPVLRKTSVRAAP